MAGTQFPYGQDYRPPPAARPIPDTRKKGKKRKVAKEGAKRGGVEGLVLFALTQLALNYGASPEISGLITPDNVALVLGFIALAMRVCEAVFLDGKSDR